MTAGSIGVLGTGSGLADNEVTNADLAERFEVSADWMVQKTHIRTRRYAGPGQATSDLAAAAARAALADSGRTADDIDFLIVSTSTGDSPQPATACLVQHAIGADRAACFDVNVACSGFVYALALAHALLSVSATVHARTDGPGHALVVGADVYSRILDPSDPRVSVLGADGAGAAVVGPVPADRGFLGFGLASRGDRSGLITIEAGGSRCPTTHETVDRGGHHLRMQGRAVREFVLANLPPALDQLVARCGSRLGDVDHFFPHQPNGVLIDQLAKEAGLTGAETHRTVERLGNMGSASVPVTLDEANRAGRLRDGDLVLLAGFGAGMSVGTCLLRWAGTGADR